LGLPPARLHESDVKGACIAQSIAAGTTEKRVTEGDGGWRRAEGQGWRACSTNECDELALTTRTSPRGMAARMAVCTAAALTTVRGPPSHLPLGAPSARWK